MDVVKTALIWVKPRVIWHRLRAYRPRAQQLNELDVTQTDMDSLGHATTQATSMILSLQIAALNLAQPFSGGFVAKYDHRPVAYLSALVCLLTIAGASLAPTLLLLSIFFFFSGAGCNFDGLLSLETDVTGEPARSYEHCRRCAQRYAMCVPFCRPLGAPLGAPLGGPPRAPLGGGVNHFAHLLAHLLAKGSTTLLTSWRTWLTPPPKGAPRGEQSG